VQLLMQTSTMSQNHPSKKMSNLRYNYPWRKSNNATYAV